MARMAVPVPKLRARGGTGAVFLPSDETAADLLRPAQRVSDRRAYEYASRGLRRRVGGAVHDVALDDAVVNQVVSAKERLNRTASAIFCLLNMPGEITQRMLLGGRVPNRSNRPYSSAAAA